MIVKDAKAYIGFYLVGGIWVDEKPDPNPVVQGDDSFKRYFRLMDEVLVDVSFGTRQIRISRDGFVACHDSAIPWLPDWDTSRVTEEFFASLRGYSDLLNALYAFILSGIRGLDPTSRLSNSEVARQDMIPLYLKDDDWAGSDVPLHSASLTQFDMRFLTHIPSTGLADMRFYLDTRLPGRGVVPHVVLADATTACLRISSHETDQALLSRSNKAAAEFANSAFSDAILITWIQVETYLHEVLQAHMAAMGSVHFNRDRRKYLDDLSVANISEILEAVGLIDMDWYTHLNRVRKVRNKIVHDGKAADEPEARDALALLERVIERKTGEVVRLLPTAL